MKKFRTNKEKIVVSSTAALSWLLLSTTFASCSRIDVDNSKDSSETYDNTNITQGFTETTTSETIVQSEKYDFIWDDNDTQYFEKYVNNKYGITIAKYVITFGLDDRLNKDFTKIVNERKQKDYKTVPFSKANYFFGYVNSDIKNHDSLDDYDNFKASLLDENNVYLGAFANKSIISFLVQNNIPFGCPIPSEYFESILKTDVYKRASSKKLIIQNPKLGNENKDLTEDELAQLCGIYNKAVYLMCVDKSVKSGNPLDDINVFVICNNNLKVHYGPKAFQIGQRITREQYIEIFGEEPRTFSNIPGAVVQVPQETMASPVSYIDYDNYNVYYNPNYNMYSEEDTGRSR